MKTRSRVPGKDLPVTNAGRIDTATGAPASGPAALPGPAPEPPGRRPALRPPVPTLVAVSRRPRMPGGRKEDCFEAAARPGLGICIFKRPSVSPAGSHEIGRASCREGVERSAVDVVVY